MVEEGLVEGCLGEGEMPEIRGLDTLASAKGGRLTRLFLVLEGRLGERFGSFGDVWV